jgi:hypothetical protein
VFSLPEVLVVVFHRPEGHPEPFRHGALCLPSGSTEGEIAVKAAIALGCDLRKHHLIGLDDGEFSLWLLFAHEGFLRR